MAAIQISDSIQQGFDSFFSFVPNLIAFLVILVIGYFVAKIVAAVVRKALQKLGLDKALHESDAGQYVESRPTPSPSGAGEAPARRAASRRWSSTSSSRLCSRRRLAR